MKVCAISDLHGTLLPIEDYFESCELVCICGDISPLEIQANSNKMRRWLFNYFLPWATLLPCEKVIFIAGNHDWSFNNLDFMQSVFSKDRKVTYLFHEEYIYTSKEGKEYKIFGTPYCKLFSHWAFMELDDTLTKLYSTIPNNLDILITHDQPYMYGDIILQEDCPWYDGKTHIGNKPLLECILEKKPKVQFNGHLHSCDHNLIEIGDTKHYNVSIKDEKYNPVYDPLILDI